MQPPLFILCLPRSFSTITGMMLGRHPQMYGVPELNLFLVETVDQWLRFGTRTQSQLHDGLLRTVAELYFGAQTDEGVRQAEDWVRERAARSTVEIVSEIGARIDPLILVDKSPATAMTSRGMERAFQGFPDARFLHLTRHPRGYGESVLRILREHEPLQDSIYRALHPLVMFPPPAARVGASAPGAGIGDPQHGWVYLNRAILQFLGSVPSDRQMQVRGEELLDRPDRILARIADWLGIRSDPAAFEEMKHPERSPYARIGPPRAWAGGDPSFLKNPILHAAPSADVTLSGPLAWRSDGAGFHPETRELAERFGYR